MINLKTICVYCGSGVGKHPSYNAAAVRLGQLIAEAGLNLVYGGGSIGLMGAVAKSARDHGAHVTGVIPSFLEEREVMMHDIAELIVTEDMHERKRLMFERADAFIALPGGVGTLEEVVEMMTWGQLGQHSKPIILANIENFWAPLHSLLGHMTGEDFIRRGFEVDYHMCDDIDEAIPTLQRLLSRGADNQDAKGEAVAQLRQL